MRRRPLLALLGVLGAAGIVVGAALFEPWQLFVDRTVDDELPAAASASAPSPRPTPPSSSAEPSVVSEPEPTPTVRRPVVLRRGELISHEHETHGSVSVIKLADGRQLVRISGLDTSSGPDLRVWLSTAPVVAGRAGWTVFDDHPHLELGELKGNRGNQNYALPSGTDLDRWTSVTIWCARFHVSFGAAELARAD